jgi:O-antigen ligase
MLGQPPISLAITEHQRRLIIRAITVVVTFAIATVGIIWNVLTMLRIGVGALVVLVILRYPYVLLISWALIDAFIGSTLSFFQGNNFDLGLTLTSILVVATMPVNATLRRMPALAFLLLYLLWTFASISISSLGIREFLTTWSLDFDHLLVGILVINLVTTQQRLRRLVDAIILVATFISVYGIYGYFTKHNGVADHSVASLFRIGSTFGNVAPSLSMFLCVVIPLIIYRTLISRGFMRSIGLILVLTSLIALLLTFTRTAFISFPLGLLIIIPFLPTRKLKVSFSAAIGLLAALAILVAVVGKAPIFDRFFSQDVTTLNGRIYLWQALIDHFDPLQVLGKGLNASDILLANLQVGGFGGGVIGTAPHNLFLGTLYDHGIIGVTLLVLVFLRLAFLLFTGMMKASGERRTLFAMATVAWVNMVILSLEGNDLWNQSIGIYFWICMVLPFARCWLPSKPILTNNQAIFNETKARNEFAGSKTKRLAPHALLPEHGVSK